MPAESMHPVINRVQCGHMFEESEYATWRARGTDDFLLIHTLSGAGRFGGEGGDIVATEGDSVLLHPGLRHDYGTVPGARHWEIAFAHFHPRSEWIPLLDWPLVLGRIGHITSGDDVHRRIASALRSGATVRSGVPSRDELFSANALEEALLWIDTQNPLHHSLDERLLRVTAHIEAHLSDDLRVRSLADVARLSESHFTRLFGEQLGLSPQRYVERERMLRAQQLLDLTDRTVANIALQVGWSDPLYFSQRFRRFVGRSPTQYRADGRRQNAALPSSA